MKIKILFINFLIIFSIALDTYAKTSLDFFEKGCNSTDNKEKENFFTEALKINPKFILAYRNRAIVRKDMQNFEGALKDLNSVIELKSNDYLTYSLRAEIFQLLNDNKAALNDFKKAYKLNPNDNNLKTKILELEAKATHNSLIKQNNNNDKRDLKKESLIEKAISARKEGKNDLALQYLNDAIKNNSKSEVYYAERGDLKISLKEFSDAISDFNMAIELNPNNSIYYTKRGKAYEFSGNSQNALNDYKKSIALDSKIPEAWYNLGWMRYKLNDFQGAIDSFNKTIELNPNFAAAYNARGWTKEDMGDIEGAKEDFSIYKKISGL